MSKKYYKIFDEDELEKITDQKGVYLIHCLNAAFDIPRSIRRMFVYDVQGILYIGSSKNIRERVQEFKDSVVGENTRHSGGTTYSNIPIVEHHYPRKYLAISFKEIAEFKKEEKKYLEIYEKEFGELPPLNKIK